MPACSVWIYFPAWQSDSFHFRMNVFEWGPNGSIMPVAIFTTNEPQFISTTTNTQTQQTTELAKLASVQDDMRTTIPKQLLEKSALATYKGLLIQDGKGKATGQQQDDTATAFSQQELLALRLLYMMIDRHNDGHITAEELLQWAASDGRGVRREEADRCVAAVDADGDGAIGMHDFLLFAAQNKEEAKEES
jgi:hypothetical protein